MNHVAIQAESLGRAMKAARQACGYRPEYVRAYDRASLLLLGGAVWRYDDEAEYLWIESASEAGREYVASFLTCSCPAGSKGRFCKHMAARDLIARSVAPPPARDEPMSAEEFDLLTARMDEMFS
jgi:SWIM zinc finger